MGRLSSSTRPRRLACEKAIQRRGFKTYEEVAKACEKQARKVGKEVTFSRFSIQNYVSCYHDLSLKRIEILADLLGVSNYKELNEIYEPPKVLDVGDYWQGNQGTRIQDIDSRETKL